MRNAENTAALPAIPDVLSHQERQDNEDDNQQHKLPYADQTYDNQDGNHICSPVGMRYGPAIIL